MKDLDLREWWLLGPIALAVVWMGVYPESFMRPFHNDVARLTARLDRVAPAGDSHLTLGTGAHAHMDMEVK
jgi:NADH-quinone oxidoreductase subunit M